MSNKKRKHAFYCSNITLYADQLCNNLCFPKIDLNQPLRVSMGFTDLLPFLAILSLISDILAKILLTSDFWANYFTD